MTRQQAMAYLRRGATWMAAHADEIGCEREGGNVYFRQSDLDAYRERGYRPAPQPQAKRQPAVKFRTVPKGLNPLDGKPYLEAVR